LTKLVSADTLNICMCKGGGVSVLVCMNPVINTTCLAYMCYVQVLSTYKFSIYYYMYVLLLLVQVLAGRYCPVLLGLHSRPVPGLYVGWTPPAFLAFWVCGHSGPHGGFVHIVNVIFCRVLSSFLFYFEGSFRSIIQGLFRIIFSIFHWLQSIAQIICLLKWFFPVIYLLQRIFRGVFLSYSLFISENLSDQLFTFTIYLGLKNREKLTTHWIVLEVIGKDLCQAKKVINHIIAQDYLVTLLQDIKRY